jgi:hypothetical protein
MTATLPGTKRKGGNQQRNRNVIQFSMCKNKSEVSVFVTLLAGKKFKISYAHDLNSYAAACN